jgi:GT2 family glycosyltransferase
VSILLGNNVGFRRDALEAAGVVEAPEFWKTFAVWRLREHGYRCWMDPKLVVTHDRATPTGEFTRNRYLNGRCFAGNRAAADPLRRRVLRAATCPLLPLIFAARQFWALRGHADYRAHWVRSLPAGLLFHAAWAVGEFDGYLRGSGNACALLA